MGKRLLQRSLGALALLGVLQTSTPILQAQTVTALTKLDQNSLQGSWYEIARLPAKREKNCVADDIEIIALADKANQLQLVDSCKVKKGYVDVKNATAKANKKAPDGRFKITSLWPLSTKYWVLALGANSEWSLIGSPNHKNLWIYSKTPSLAPDVLAEIEAKATAEGFAPAKLALTRQTTTQLAMQ